MSAPAKGGEGEGKKKGGKMPIIIAAVVVLGGGGYFMMGKKGGKAEKPKVEIGHDVVEMGELLVNMKGGESYARVNVGLQFVKGFDTHALEGSKAPMRDAIIMVLSNKTIADVSSAEGKENLKLEMCWAINNAFHALHPAEEEDKKSDKKSDKKDKKDEGHGDEHGGDHHAFDPHAERENPEWHSDEGPVLKIHFADFITQ